MTKEQGKRLRLSVWREALFLAILVTPVIVLSEVIVRLMREPPGFFPVNQLEAPLYMPDPIRGYTLKPLAHSDYVTPELDVDMDISADGIRDAPLATAREAGFRVLAVGDSFTMGLAVRQKDTWSEQLERLLNSKDRSKTAAVVNGGSLGTARVR